MTVGTDSLLAGVSVGMTQQGIDIAVAELLTDHQDMLIMTAIIIIRRIDLGIRVAIRPVLTGGIITVTGRTAGLESRRSSMRVTGDTVGTGVVAPITVGRLVELANLGVVTGLTDTCETAIAVVGPISSIGETCDCLASRSRCGTPYA